MANKDRLVKFNEKSVVQINSMPIYEYVKDIGEVKRKDFVKKMGKVFEECLNDAILKLREMDIIRQDNRGILTSANRIVRIKKQRKGFWDRFWSLE